MEAPEFNPKEPGESESSNRPLAPGVTAIIVADRPGSWFDEMLASLQLQDYSRLKVLVLCAADQLESIRARVHEILPEATVRDRGKSEGFGAAINSLRGKSLTPFWLLCHDDVALAPDAVRRLVEEAIRSNAGIVGPKFVDWDDPTIVRQVGLGADKMGAPVPIVEPDELDQEQHDGVRDVFMTSAATMLVRSDLFDALDGFDDAIDFRGEDLDLCWRAHAAGARVMVAPSAVVRHKADLESRRPADRPLAQRKRHQLRAMLANYGPLHLIRVFPQAVVVTIVEFLFALVTGRLKRARAVNAAWIWNFKRLPSLAKRRRSLRSVRTVKDADVRRFQAGGFAPIATYFRSRREAPQAVSRGRQVIESVRSGKSRNAALVWAFLILLYLFGVRHLATRGIPIYGEFTSFGDGPRSALNEWLSGWRDEGLGREGPAPISTLFVSIFGFVTLGKVALARTILFLGAPLVGALGIWRGLKPFALPRTALVGLVAYMVNPLVYNALANGSLSALVLFAAAPWLLAALARGAQQSPYGQYDGGRGPGVPLPSVLRELLGLGLLTAVVMAFVPFGLVSVAFMAASLFVGSMLTGHVLGNGRLIIVTAVGGVLAVLLQLPAGLEALSGQYALLAGTRSEAASAVSLSELARFDVGPTGSGVIGWALVIAAVLPLVLARGPRFAWAVRGWVLYLAAVGLALAAAHGLLPTGVPRPEVLLVPGAVGLAIATAMGMAAFETDLRRYRFGWRQVVPVTAFIALGLAVLPMIGATINGRFEAPRRDFATTLENIRSEDSPGVSRTLWIGMSDVVPTSGWEYTDGVVYSLSDSSTTTILDRSTGASTDETEQIATALDMGFTQATSRFGSLVGPMGVRYIVVPQRLAPAPHGSIQALAPPGLLAMLDNQLDLEQIELSPGIVVYRNASWVPVRASVTTGATTVGAGSFQDAVLADLSGATAVLESGRTDASGPVPGGADVYVAAGGQGWELEVDGRRALETEAFGWAQSFNVEPGTTTDATLSYSTPTTIRLQILAQLIAWILVIAVVARLVSIDREGV